MPGWTDCSASARHTRTHLPRYATPIFVRLIKERSATHNNKQDKKPLKDEGIDPARVKNDPLLWISKHGRGDTYVPFTQKDYDTLKGGGAKL